MVGDKDITFVFNTDIARAFTHNSINTYDWVWSAGSFVAPMHLITPELRPTREDESRPNSEIMHRFQSRKETTHSILSIYSNILSPIRPGPRFCRSRQTMLTVKTIIIELSSDFHIFLEPWVTTCAPKRRFVSWFTAAVYLNKALYKYTHWC